MLICRWEELPLKMQTEEVRPYYEILRKKRYSLYFKRLFDIVISLFLLILLAPFCLVMAAAIKLDSKGPVFYRQVRVTQYGKRFRIHKFRSMEEGADKGAQVTSGQDMRITRIGAVLRRYRLDEIGQLIDILNGTMTFVGTRPEVPGFVDKYTPEMWATLLLPAGVTSEASIQYKDEALLLDTKKDTDIIYVEQILPEKMKINLEEIKRYSFFRDVFIMLRTLKVVIKAE